MSPRLMSRRLRRRGRSEARRPFGSLLRGKSYLSVPEQERLHLDRGDRIFESLNTPEDLAEAREDFERREKKF